MARKRGVGFLRGGGGGWYPNAYYEDFIMNNLIGKKWQSANFDAERQGSIVNELNLIDIFIREMCTGQVTKTQNTETTEHLARKTLKLRIGVIIAYQDNSVTQNV